MRNSTRIIRSACLFIVGLMVFSLRGSAQEPAEPEDRFVYNAHERRDPFSPLVNAQGLIISYEKDLELGDLILEGVFVDAAGSKAAIINGKILQVNEAIGDFTVQDIKENKVILQNGQERVILKLKKEE